MKQPLRKPDPRSPAGRDLEYLLPWMDGGNYPIFSPNTIINTNRIDVGVSRACIMMLDTDTVIRIQHSDDPADLSSPFMLKANIPFGIAWPIYAIVLDTARNVAIMQHGG